MIDKRQGIKLIHNVDFDVDYVKFDSKYEVVTFRWNGTEWIME